MIDKETYELEWIQQIWRTSALSRQSGCDGQFFKMGG